MTNMQSEVFQAFRSIEIPKDKAAASKSDRLVVKWMLGFVLAFQVAIISKIFSR